MGATIIAEAGINHGGSLRMACELADMAKDVGADVVKFQTAIPELEVSVRAPLASYQVRAGGPATQLELVRGLTLSLDATRSLAHHCRNIGIEFMSTPADPVSLRFLVNEAGVQRLKIGSGDLTNPQLLLAARNAALPIILSTGMANENEIFAALGLIGLDDVTLLHCVSCYPAAEADQNVWAIPAMIHRAQIPVGFSDHTTGSLAAQLAVACGACMIEKHLTLDNSAAGPDHAASMDPVDFAGFVQDIRRAEKALGHGFKQPCLAEMLNAPAVRKSLVAARAIAAGEEFSSENLAVKRPGTGRSPWDYFELIGKPATRSYEPDELIE